MATGDAAPQLNMQHQQPQPRKRTSSLGSHTSTTHSSRLSSPELDLRSLASNSNGDGAGSAVSPPAWTGPRSGSAPPERRVRMATLMTSDSAAEPQSEDDASVNAATAAAAEDGSNATQASINDNEEQRADHPRIDKLLLDGLLVAKDRLLLLRSDIEMEKLANDTLRTRLRVAPPGFPPNLNSYQRLLIHRLADMWSITRELEPASTGNSPTQPSAASAGSMISGTIVLVKTETTKTPSIRIASLAPPPTPDLVASSTIAGVSLVSKVSELNLDIQNKATSPSIAVMSIPTTSSIASVDENKAEQLPPNSAASFASHTSISATSSTSASPASSLGPVRIMSRAANAAARAGLNKSRSPSAGSGTSGMTFEEREAAYQQARMRIFNESQKPVNGPLDPQQASRPSSTPAAQDFQQPQQNGHSNHQSYQPLPQGYMQQQQQYQQAQQFSPMQSMQMNNMGMQMNPSLRPSAPVFVYQPPLEGMQQQGHFQPQQHSSQPQQFAYYPVQGQPEGSMQPGPPIQITMSSPALMHAQQPQVPVAYAPYPMQMPQPGFVPAHAPPFPRPTSAHSHSSQSSISTTTSQSSIRTASTSSAQRSTLSTSRGYISPGLNLRPMRQVPPTAGPSTRQVKPTPRSSGGGSSTHSNASVHSRHSQSSSSSSPSVAGDSVASVHPASSQTSKSDSSSPERGVDSKDEASSSDTALVEPHPVLPARPEWIDSANSSSKAASSSASSVSSNSSRERASDIADDPSSIHRDDAHTPLSSTSGKTSARGQDEASRKLDGAPDLPIVVEDEVPDARSTPLPHFAQLPPDRPNGSLSESGRSDKHDTASQASSSKSSRKNPPANQPRVIENPPLRYDKQKGWTVLSSSALLQANQANQGQHTAGNKQRKPPSPAASVASSSNWSQHAFQPTVQYIQSMPGQHQPNGHPQQYHGQYAQQPPQQQYMIVPVPVNGQAHGFPAQSMPPQFIQPQSQVHMQAGTSPQAVMTSLPSQQGFQPGQMSYQPQAFSGNMPHYQGQQQQQQSQVYYQPIPHEQASFPSQQPPYGHFVQAQTYPSAPTGGLTPADMMASGEMLYSYDLPRPVPRSGATLFDPNASN